MSDEGKDQSPDRGQISAADRDAIRRRSAELRRNLDEVNARRAPPSQGKEREEAFGTAFKFAAELVVGVVVGGGIGWVLDRQFGTAPWLMIVLVILGFAAGLLNVVRAARAAQAINEPLQKAAPSVKDDGDD